MISGFLQWCCGEPKKIMNKNVESDTSKQPITEETSKGGYCNLMTPFLTKSVSDHTTTLKLLENLEMQEMHAKHLKIDKEIETISNRIKDARNDAKHLDRQLFNAFEIKKQELLTFEKTGQMMHLLKEETDELQAHTEQIEIKRLSLKKKAENVLENQKKEKESRKTIEKLEGQIKEVLNEPEPLMDEKLVKKNIELKQKLNEKQKQAKMRRIRKTQIAALKNKKIDLLQQIAEKQDRNWRLKDKVDQKKIDLTNEEAVRKDKVDHIEETINTNHAKFNELLNEYEERKGVTEEMKVKTNEMKLIIEKEEENLKGIKMKIENTRRHQKEVSETQEKEYQEEMEKLKIVDGKLGEIVKENEDDSKQISKIAQHLLNIKEEKCELTKKLCDKKCELLTMQHHTGKQEADIEVLHLKLDEEIRQFEELKAKKEDAESKYNHIKQELDAFPLKMDQRSKQMEKEHEDKMKILLKEQNIDKATIEVLQVRLIDNLKKIADLEKEIKKQDDKKKWEENNYERKKTYLTKIQENVVRGQKICEKLDEMRKQTDNIKESKQSKEHQYNNDDNVIDLIEEEDKKSGRRSPGILKSPLKKTGGVVMPNKRVTFEGISSTESSSGGATSVINQVEVDEMDELLKDWAPSSYLAQPRRRNLDF